MTFPPPLTLTTRRLFQQRLPQAFVVGCGLAAGLVELLALQRRRWHDRQRRPATTRPF